MSKKIMLVVFGVAMLMGLTACASREKNSNVAASDATKQNIIAENAEKLRIGAREIAADLDPVASLVAAYLVNVGAGELLFKVDENGVPQPFLALSSEQVSSTEWKIKLREGISFWSGKAVGADAVIASLERSRKLDLKALPFIEMMTFLKVGENELKVTTTQPNIDVPLNLSYYQLIVHNAEMAFDTVKNMDLTGMYKVVEYIPGQKMVLKKNENYWGTKPTIETVVHEQISDAQARVVAALSGEYHVVLNIPVSSMAQFKDSDVAEISATEATNSETIYFNLKNKKFQDEGVRQALSWGLDREELIKLGTEGLGEPVTTWLGSNPQYSDIRSAVYNKPDSEKAASLLDAAGWVSGDDGLRRKDGEVLTLRLMTWGIDQALGEAIQAQWSKLGVDAQVQYGDYSLIETARNEGDWDAFIEAWNTYGDVVALLKGQYSTDGGGNYGSYNDSMTNELFDKIDAERSSEKRTQLMKELSVHIAKQAPVICICPRPELTAVSTKLSGFTPHFRQFENVVNANLIINK